MPLWNYRAHSKGDTMGRRSHTRDAHCQRYCFHHAFTMHGPPCENRQEMRCHSGVVEQTARRRGVKNRSSNRQQKRILDFSRTLRPRPAILFSSHTDRQRTTLRKWSRNMTALRRKGANSQPGGGGRQKSTTYQTPGTHTRLLVIDAATACDIVLIRHRP